MENAHFWRRSHFQLSPRHFHLFHQSNFDGKPVSVLASDISTYKFDYLNSKFHLLNFNFIFHISYFQLLNLFNEDFYVHGVIWNYMYNWKQVQDWRQCFLVLISEYLILFANFEYISVRLLGSSTWSDNDTEYCKSCTDWRLFLQYSVSLSTNLYPILCTLDK